jgi:hypothetical protein
VTYNPELDQVMISSRQFSEVWVIDHSTTTEEARGSTGGRYGRGGDLLYRWGNPQTYNRGGVADRRLYGQHDANWLADSQPGTGHILCFNNGVWPGHAWSVVDEFVPPVDSLGFYSLLPDTTYGPDSALWSYGEQGQFFAAFVGGAQRLPNGNTLICNGPAGELFEVTHDSTIVWRYVNPVSDTGPMFQYESVPANSNQVFKTMRYSPDYPAFAGRNLVPGEPIERYRTGLTESPKAQIPSSRTLSAISCQLSAGSDDIRVRFVLSRPGRVTATICNSLGQTAAAPVAADLAAGEQEIRIPAHGLPAGAYVLALRADRDVQTARFVILY